ncbi:MAG: CAP domain-containing protein [Oscillospiraceae bacterium]|jgi:uncharacterized YkwD family protein|nr:CAP domain-containing protein [Oscillospiraceae bacterium]
MKRFSKHTLTALLMSVLLLFSGIQAFAFLWGDIDQNGALTAADARLALRASANLEALDETQKELCDVDRDNKITAADARMILRVSAGLEKEDTSGTDTNTETPPPQGDDAVRAYEKAVVALTNNYRRANGLSDLKENTKLSQVARTKSQDMLEKGYFAHESPTYGTPFAMMKQFGITYRSAGENIAKGYQTPEEVVNGWWNSPGHRQNMLNASFTEIGVGYVANGRYWTQMFIG